MRYVFAGASLPEIALGQEPDITFREFMTLLRENLTENDLATVEKLLAREPVDSHFAQKLLDFERDVTYALAVLRAKRLGKEFEGAESEPAESFEVVKEIFGDYVDDPLALHKALTEYRFSVIEQMEGLNPFALEHILGYAKRLVLVEQWQTLDSVKGVEYMNRLTDDKK